MAEEAQVQLVVVAVRAEASQAQMRDLEVQVGEHNVMGTMAAAAMRVEAHHAELSKSIEAMKMEKRRADTAEAQVLQVQDDLATVTWRVCEREEQGDSCYNELRTRLQVLHVHRNNEQHRWSIPWDQWCGAGQE